MVGFIVSCIVTIISNVYDLPTESNLFDMTTSRQLDDGKPRDDKTNIYMKTTNFQIIFEAFVWILVLLCQMNF